MTNMIFWDVDTQNDFMNPNGALYVPGAAYIRENLNSITQSARKRFMPVLGSVDKHFGTPEYKEREGELQKWGGPFPNHCMRPSFGQKKVIETILDGESEDNTYEKYLANPLLLQTTERDIYFSLLNKNDDAEALILLKNWNGNLRAAAASIYKANTTGMIDVLVDDFVEETKLIWERRKKPVGMFFEKQSYDVFTDPNVAEYLKRADVKEAVVYGVATDYCVRAAVLGMQQRGIQCYVVEDAIKGVSADTTQKALDEMKASGAKFVTTRQVLEEMVR
jgi:nicotinamidase-related amidase